jgi:hypothetical protein
MQFLSSLCKRPIGQSQTRRAPAAKPAPRFRPQLEALDDRLVPSTLTVTNTLDDGSAGSLRSEIAAAQSGDTIVFDPSLSGQIITLGGYGLGLNKNLNIEGPGANSLAISAANQSQVFAVAFGAQVTLSGMTIENGRSFTASGSGWEGYFDGGGILNDGTLTLSGDTLSGNVADYGDGGGIANHGTLTVTGTTLSGNSATYDGGGIANYGTLTVTSSTLSGNRATAGGGIYNDGTMTLSGSTVTQNSTYTTLPSGGGIFNDYGGNLTVYGSVVTGNSPDDVFTVGKWKHQKSTIGKVDS